jgi:hypothetical protein
MLGASECIGVDVDYESLVSASMNAKVMLNERATRWTKPACRSVVAR